MIGRTIRNNTITNLHWKHCKCGDSCFPAVLSTNLTSLNLVIVREECHLKKIINKKIAVEFILFPKMFCSSYFFLPEKRSQMIQNTEPNLVYISAWFYSSYMAAAAAGIRHWKESDTAGNCRNRRRNAVVGEVMWGRGLFSEYLLYQITANLLQLKRSPLVRRTVRSSASSSALL